MTEWLSMGPHRMHAKAQRLLQLIWCLWVVFGKTRTEMSVYLQSPTLWRGAPVLMSNNQWDSKAPR